MNDKLFVVIPCYNEQEVLLKTAEVLKNKLLKLIENNMISNLSRIMFVNDGSKDNTWGIIESLVEQDSIFAGVNLSRNKGHQNALLAGIDVASEYADIVISMDADLQDDINAIDKMLDAYAEGNEVVYGVRSSREKDTFFKKNTAQAFYKLLKFLGADVVYNHADYRLLSKRAALALLTFKEVNLFLRGLVPMVGFKSTTVSYERGERFAGESKYPLRKMLKFAFEGITSLSVKPIRMITLCGCIVFMISLIMLIKSLFAYISGQVVAGWTSTMISIWAIGGFQIFSIGIIGEYIGKTYLETKARPRYIIESILLK